MSLLAHRAFTVSARMPFGGRSCLARCKPRVKPKLFHIRHHLHSFRPTLRAASGQQPYGAHPAAGATAAAAPSANPDPTDSLPYPKQSLFSVHLAMWETDRARDVACNICIAGASVDHDDVGEGSLEIDGQIP
jgi:hypothetical protein